jgi:hypothetical protein
MSTHCDSKSSLVVSRAGKLGHSIATLQVKKPSRQNSIDKESTMRIALLICPFVVSTALAAAAEPLEQRFGAERERGYRAERGLNHARPGFENRDRSNFLGAPVPNAEPRQPAANSVRACRSACRDG